MTPPRKPDPQRFSTAAREEAISAAMRASALTKDRGVATKVVDAVWAALQAEPVQEWRDEDTPDFSMHGKAEPVQEGPFDEVARASTLAAAREGAKKPPRDFWREVPCGHPPDPMAWIGPLGPVCHCGWMLDEADRLPVSVEGVSIVRCDKCGCAVGIQDAGSMAAPSEAPGPKQESSKVVPVQTTDPVRAADREPRVETVTVPLESLRLLYECAKDYGTRIPQGGHFAWAFPFIEMFESPDARMEGQDD